MEGVLRRHVPAVCKISQPVWEWACSQQRLVIADDFDINIEKTLKLPLCVWGVDVCSSESLSLFLSQPLFSLFYSIKPGGAFFFVFVVHVDSAVLNVGKLI